VEYLRKHHRLLIELLNVSNEEEIAEFIQMAIKRIDIKYIKGTRGKTLNTMEIENVEFY
jgi:site-specific DNA recombinase